MSRITTPQTTPTNTPQNQTKVPHDKIAMRAYEKWIKRGRPQDSGEQDWLEAEAELRVEQTRGGNSNPSQPNRR